MICEICGSVPDCVVAYYREHSFIDGHKHEIVCHCCAFLPRFYSDDAGLVIHGPRNFMYRLHTIKEMIEDGWKKEEILKSLHGLRKIMNKKILPTVPILNELYITKDENLLITIDQ